MRKGVLAEAGAATSGARQDDYGHPADNHGCTAELWAAYLSRKNGRRVRVSTRDVCWLNVLQKASRDAHSSKRDNLVDGAGYLENAGRIEDA